MPPVAYVYILQSAADGRFYIGYTTDLERRVRQHREGAGRWTKGKGRWKLRYFEAFDDDRMARRRELQLKRAKNKRYLEWLCANGPGNSPTPRR